MRQQDRNSPVTRVFRVAFYKQFAVGHAFDPHEAVLCYALAEQGLTGRFGAAGR